MKCENCLHYGVCTFAKQYKTVDKCIDYVDKDLYIVLLGKTNIILKEKLKWMKK